MDCGCFVWGRRGARCVPGPGAALRVSCLWTGKGKTKQKPSVELVRLCLLHGIVLHGAVRGTVLLETGGHSGGSVGEGSARSRVPRESPLPGGLRCLRV